MRILYLSVSYLPSRRASSVHVMKMCAALARCGHRLTLVAKGCPGREEPGVAVGELHRFYGVEPAFEVVKLSRPEWRGGGLLYLATMKRLLRRMRGPADLVYSRDLPGAWLAARSGMPVIFEAHGPPGQRAARWLWRRLTASPRLLRLVAISHALQRILDSCELLPRAGGDCVVAHDAADPALPSSDGPPPEARQPGRLDLGYVGNLYPGRGIELILRLAERRAGDRFHIVGGAAEDLDRLRSAKIPDNVRFHGFVPPSRLHDHYPRFDAVLMPYQRRVLAATRRSDISGWISPMKLFEYMAAGRAILSSDLPVLREVLEHERNALLLPPENVDAWDQALSRLRDEPGLRRRLGREARADHARHHTWDHRAERVLRGL